MRNNPIRYTDPSGHNPECGPDGIYCDNNPNNDNIYDPLLVFSSEGNRTLSNDAKNVMRQGAWDIATALADELREQCAQEIAMGMASDCTSIDPASAFFAAYGGPVEVVRKAGTCSDFIGDEYPDCSAWGYSREVNEIWIFDSVGGRNMNDVIISHPNLIVHELGHSFYKAAGGYISGSSIGERNGLFGFYQDYQWQFGIDSPGDYGIELFADMFVGWVYGMWEPGDEPNGLSRNGAAKSAYMDKYMPLMINKAIGR